MREDLIRAAFSCLAAAVTLVMAQEHLTWALERRQAWWFVTGIALAGLSLFETHKVWRRGETLLRISHAT